MGTQEKNNPTQSGHRAGQQECQWTSCDGGVVYARAREHVQARSRTPTPLHPLWPRLPHFARPRSRRLQCRNRSRRPPAEMSQLYFSYDLTGQNAGHERDPGGCRPQGRTPTPKTLRRRFLGHLGANFGQLQLRRAKAAAVDQGRLQRSKLRTGREGLVLGRPHRCWRGQKQTPKHHLSSKTTTNSTTTNSLDLDLKNVINASEHTLCRHTKHREKKTGVIRHVGDL